MEEKSSVTPSEEPGRKVSINLVSANIFSLVLLLVVAIASAIPFHLLWPEAPVRTLGSLSLLGMLGFLLVFLAGVFVHELIHGLTWAYFAPSGWKSISFGVIWKMLTPYCHCNEPLRRRPYLWGALMPCVVLGILPLLLAMCTGYGLLLVFGILFTAAAAGDLWMAWLLLKERPDCLVLDHPSEAGFYVIES